MRPVIVRLPNWIGDVVMALPAVEHLAQSGFTPLLLGRRWAAPLLAAYDWEILVQPQGLRARVAQLQEQRRRALRLDPGFDGRPNTLLLTNSFSSGLEIWLARLRSVGYRQDGRGWLLRHPVAPPQTPTHESTRFWRLATELTGRTLPQPAQTRLRVAAPAQQAADALLAGPAAGGFACIVPFATGTMNGRNKAWPAFPQFARWLRQTLTVVVVPGPGEAEAARRLYPDAICFEGVDVGVYAGILKRARLVVANDTGPGHIAAAVGAPLVSVLGPTDAQRHRPQGRQVVVVQQSPWPTLEAVAGQVRRLLDASAKP
jgi:heptosyltransferase-2